MKKSELIQLIRETIEDELVRVTPEKTPYVYEHASDGVSGDSYALLAEEAAVLELAANKLADAAHHTVLTGEGLTELDRAVAEFDRLTNRRR